MVGDGGAVALHREDGAGLDAVAAHMDDAGAALAGVAADMRAGQAQLFAQQLDQQRARFDLDLVLSAVHRQRDLRHFASPPDQFFRPRSGARSSGGKRPQPPGARQAAAR
jgi:hypothetical protein